jgi:hypothetical protein
MASLTTNSMHIKQFSDSIIEAVQQNNSRLDGTVRRKEAVKAESFFFNKLGSLQLVEKTERNAPTPYLDPYHSRRKLITSQFHGAVFVDSFDENRTNINGLPSDYMTALKKAAMRKKDDILIYAATAKAREGKEGEIEVNFPTGNIVPNAAAGLTVERLLNALEIMKEKDVDPEEKIYCIINAKAERKLLDEEKIINRDYSQGAVLDKGIIGSWNRINFIHSERLLLDSNNDRQILLYTETALGLGVSTELKVKMADNPDRSFTPTIYVEMDMGAARIEDEKIVVLPCTE